MFDFEKYSFENTIENLHTDVEEETEYDEILNNVKEVIRNEKRFEYLELVVTRNKGRLYRFSKQL